MANQPRANIQNLMPPEVLLQPLPPKGIPAPPPVRTPLVMLPDDAVSVAVAKAKLGVPALLVSEQTQDPAQFVNTLLELGETQAVMGFLAWSLPKRLGLWWAFDSCWTTLLDQDRTAALNPHKGSGAATDSKTAAAPPKNLEFEDASKKLKDVAAKAQKNTQAIMSQFNSEFNMAKQKMIEHFQALDKAQGEAPPLAAALAQARHRKLQMTATRVEQNTNMKPRKTPVIKTEKMGAGKKPLPHHAPDGLKPLHANIKRRELEGQLRGMACCLQWILDPCQTNAIEAMNALPHIHNSPPSTALAKATFWCGENMSADPKKPQVPPPPTLPLKGISVALTKAGSIKKTSWTKEDKIHWYLTNGLNIAAGRRTWDGAGEQFDTYVNWSLDTKAPEGNTA